MRSAPCECAGLCMPARVALCVTAYALGGLCVSARCVWTRECLHKHAYVWSSLRLCVCALACLV